uniref:IST1 homolog isoform X1 n=1 Tax=Oncorhynchus gorbuscha TaxID=8017 RepID=UPI001EAF07E5|nr:IST1 homolog isoform X1 [Oncorhynchus gorbuscha]
MPGPIGFNGPSVGTYDAFNNFQPPMRGGHPPELPSCPPTYESIDELSIKPSDRSQVSGPGPSSQIYNNNALPELPSVSDTLPTSSFGVGRNTASSDDIDFDDLSRRFEDLKKKT